MLSDFKYNDIFAQWAQKLKIYTLQNLDYFLRSL